MPVSTPSSDNVCFLCESAARLPVLPVCGDSIACNDVIVKMAERVTSPLEHAPVLPGGSESSEYNVMQQSIPKIS